MFIYINNIDYAEVEYFHKGLPARVNDLPVTIPEKRDDGKQKEFADFLARKEGISDNPPDALWGVRVVPTHAHQQAQGAHNIQKQAASMVSGAFRTTAAEALNTELHLPPISVHMSRLVKETALRLRTGPVFAVPPLMLRRRPAEERD
ncbi:zinc knuckle domain protein [Penicillium bovifimosum]|uniref:Zinc knuckle domain protein n=1 Tax=Penicillium bovifimosum TaxID=126998 RepID=A0A9W9H577_9EURO|nr:zinc knuckle domain protein [Penicillium bovifimosum]KAJ5138905.1 zinc knuckle domain protein [Penicillium bovifimosum]